MLILQYYLFISCECAVGYGGGDCSRLFCPVGAAWADQAIATDFAHQPVECSNKGICDRVSGTHSKNY